MSSNFETSSFNQEKPRSPLITWGIVLLTIMGCLCLVADVFFFFNPERIPLLVQAEPTATATILPTSTSVPDIATATQAIVTATSQNIEALAIDSVSVWPVLLSEPFNSNENDWIVGSDESEYADITRQIEDGKYVWDVSAKQSVISWVAADTKPLSNFHLTAEMRKISGSDQSDWGLVFREDSDGNLYYFGIDDDEFFVLLSYELEWIDMIEFTKSSAILAGDTNRLTVIADGSHFAFYINDQYVGEMTDDRIATGTAAVAVELYEADLQATFEFDNFELRTP